MSALRDLLQPVNILDAYKSMASINAPSKFYQFFDAKKASQQVGETFEVMTYTDTRKTAPTNKRGAPARTLDLVGGAKTTFTPLRMFNEIHIPATDIEFLRQDSSPMIQDRGSEYLRSQMEYFARKHLALKQVALAKAFTGNIYFDANGDILESSSGAATTVATGVAADHASQLNHTSAGGNIIGTAWDNAAASILTDLEQIREAAEYDQSPTPKHVWMHSVAKPWILTNTEIKSVLSTVNPQAAEWLKTYASLQDDFVIGDWTFHFTNATYIGADGSTVRPLIPKTVAIITPEVNDGDWFLNIEGGETVPKDDGVIGSLDEYFSNTMMQFGDFGYARIIDNPVKVAVRLGFNGLKAFKDPNAVWYPTVDF